MKLPLAWLLTICVTAATAAGCASSARPLATVVSSARTGMTPSQVQQALGKPDATVGDPSTTLAGMAYVTSAGNAVVMFSDGVVAEVDLHGQRVSP